MTPEAGKSWEPKHLRKHPQNLPDPLVALLGVGAPQLSTTQAAVVSGHLRKADRAAVINAHRRVAPIATGRVLVAAKALCTTADPRQTLSNARLVLDPPWPRV